MLFVLPGDRAVHKDLAGIAAWRYLRPDPMMFNIYSDRTLQHRKSNYHLLLLIIPDEKTFQTRQRTALESYPVPPFRERIRFCPEFGSDSNLNCRNFRVVYGNGDLPYPRQS